MLSICMLIIENFTELSITPSTCRNSGGYPVVNHWVYFATFTSYFHNKEIKVNWSIHLVYFPNSMIIDC